MVICPKCKREIKNLCRIRTGTEYSDFFIDDYDDCATYDNEQFEEDNIVNKYACPECQNELFNDWDEAEKFLKDKDPLQELVAEKIENIKNGKTKI